jgi:hypothetical protein
MSQWLVKVFLFYPIDDLYHYSEENPSFNTYNAVYVRICLMRPVKAKTINTMENGMKNSGRPFPWDPM